MKIFQFFFSVLVISILVISTITNVSLANADTYLSQYMGTEIVSTDSDWNCETYTANVYPETTFCPLHGEFGHYYVYKYVYDRVCDNGLLTWCYPGYQEYFYYCQGVYTGWQDYTYINNCPGGGGE